MKTSQTIRRRYLDYFKKQKHAVIASSSVIPHEDPSLLFANAGMNQFKDVFLGKSRRDYTRATTSQKCLRARDLDNVGHTKRHLTFFEMLGNFSFGDYFKKEAIQFAWEVSTEIFNFPAERIWPSVFRDDDEAFELWTRYVPEERIARMGEKDNFWAMGETGPCGPCSELLFDRGERYGSGRNPIEDVSGERFLEYWNLVFMQYNRYADGSKEPLPRPCIDTGSGLERVMLLLNNVDTVMDTDILRGLIAQTEEVFGLSYEAEQPSGAAFRVIADHIRALSFAIADGAQPSNVDRGYVLRKILRRAVRYGRQLTGMDKPFLAKILPRLVKEMGEDYPELKASEDRIAEILTAEEEAFQRTLRRGQNMLGQIIERAQEIDQVISGDAAFKLKDTYGFPLDEILLIAKDAGLKVDEHRYEELEEEAKIRSRKVHKVTEQLASESEFASYASKHSPCIFSGYDRTSLAARVQGLVSQGSFVDVLRQGEEGWVLLDSTPFYAEMGGQVGDTGVLSKDGFLFRVADTKTPYKGVVAHIGAVVEGELHVGDVVEAEVDLERRQKIANNHTATHLLHWALRQILGDHVQQRGSIVEPQRLRFDFSHHKALSEEEIRAVENLVNVKIRENKPVQAYEVDYEQAMQQAEIRQFFGEKYGSRVRVVDVDYSKELCGGTHTASLGTIGYFRIAKEGSIAAGIRRIEGVTGEEAEALARQGEEVVAQLAALVKVPPSKLGERIEKMLQENSDLSKRLSLAQEEKMRSQVERLMTQVEQVGGHSLLLAEVTAPIEALRSYMDEVMGRLPSGVAVLASREEGKCQCLIRVSDDLVKKGLKASDLVALIAPMIEGKGGGKPGSAQVGGKTAERLSEAFAQVREALAKHYTEDHSKLSL